MNLNLTFEHWVGLPAKSIEKAGWTCWPVLRGNPMLRERRVVAILALRGFEVHFAIAPERRGRLGAKDCLRALALHFEERGFLTTRVAQADTVARRFVERLGFDLTQSDSGFDHYMLSALPYSRGT